jgi:hypothetical protein
VVLFSGCAMFWIVQERIIMCCIRWDAPRELSNWVSRLSESVTKFEERVEQLLISCHKVDVAVTMLEKI